MTAYESKQKQKAFYIPLVASGKLSIRKAAKILNLSAQSVFVLKHRFIKDGNKIFTNGHEVELSDNKVQDCYGDRMPIVEKDLIARFLLKDIHSEYA